MTDKTMEFIYPSCSTCKYMKSMSFKSIKEKTDNGGIHFKYLYEWTVECEKEGKMVEIIEGTKHRVPLPTCSLWRFRLE